MKPCNELPLTPKQQLFCDEYLIDMNATRAALRAGYSSATALSGQLMTFPKIRAHIDARREAMAKETQLNQKMIIAELAKIAFCNMGDYFGADGKPKPMNEVSENAKAALWNVKVSEKDGEATLSIRTYNKLAALRKLLEYFEYNEPPKDVKYAYIDKVNVDACDRFEDDTMEEPKPAANDDEEEYDEDDDSPEDSSEEARQRQEAATKERETEIYVDAVRETELRCKVEFEQELQTIRKHYQDLEDKRLEEEARKIGVPCKKYVAHIRRQMGLPA